MNVTIERTYLEKETVGILKVHSNDATIQFSCSTLELPNLNNQHDISCINEGIYQVIKEKPSGTFNYIHFRILNVSGRDGVLIHIGNYATGKQVDTHGCILVGKDLVDMNGDKQLDVNYSNVILAKLVSLLPNEFELEIKKKV
jgi:hypothetical protein